MSFQEQEVNPLRMGASALHDQRFSVTLQQLMRSAPDPSDAVAAERWSVRPLLGPDGEAVQAEAVAKDAAITLTMRRLALWMKCHRQTVIVGPTLFGMFDKTDVTGIEVGPLPHPVMFFAFPRSGLRARRARHGDVITIAGTMVWLGEKIMVAPWSDRNWMMPPFHLPKRVTAESILSDGWSEDYDGERPVFFTENIAPVVTRVVVNALLYMTSRGAEFAHPFQPLALAGDDRRPSQRKAARNANRTITATWLAPSVERYAESVFRDPAARAKMARHVVMGHWWPREPTALHPQRRWVQPYLRGGATEDVPMARNYRIAEVP